MPWGDYRGVHKAHLHTELVLAAIERKCAEWKIPNALPRELVVIWGLLRRVFIKKNKDRKDRKI